MNDLIERTFYLTVGKKGGYSLRLEMPRLTTNKPNVPKGHIALKFSLQVPKSLFDEFIPSGVITLPEEASIGRPAIEVEVPEGIEITSDVRLQLVAYDEAEETP